MNARRQMILNGLEGSVEERPAVSKRPKTSKRKTTSSARVQRAESFEPPNLGEATRLPVPDFGNPDQRPVCLEVDFPIAPVNALSNLEGNAGKPIYQMSKWWARRRSSVFAAR